MNQPRSARVSISTDRNARQIRLVCLAASSLMLPQFPAIALPPVEGIPPIEDIPEEVLRTEIITEARSPIDGKRLTAAEYAELQAQLAKGPETPPTLSPKVRRTVGLLRLRRLIRTFFPFLLR